MGEMPESEAVVIQNKFDGAVRIIALLQSNVSSDIVFDRKQFVQQKRDYLQTHIPERASKLSIEEKNHVASLLTDFITYGMQHIQQVKTYDHSTPTTWTRRGSVLPARYGLDGKGTKTLKAVGKLQGFGVSSTNVSQHEMMAVSLLTIYIVSDPAMNALWNYILERIGLGDQKVDLVDILKDPDRLAATAAIVKETLEQTNQADRSSMQATLLSMYDFFELLGFEKMASLICADICMATYFATKDASSQARRVDEPDELVYIPSCIANVTLLQEFSTGVVSMQSSIADLISFAKSVGRSLKDTFDLFNNPAEVKRLQNLRFPTYGDTEEIAEKVIQAIHLDLLAQQWEE